jgi:putative ABC transport system permease protein
VRSLWAAGLLLRRLRTELGMVLLLFVVIAGTSFLFAAAPRLFNRAADDGLRGAMLAASAAQRNLVLADEARLSPGVDGGVSGVRAAGAQLAGRFPATLSGLISDRSLRLTTVRLSIGDPPSYDTYLSLRYQDGLTGATRLVSGRWPASRGVALPPTQWEIGAATPGGGTDVKPVIIEVAVSIAEAPELGVHLGDRLAISPDGTDPLLARLNTGPVLGRGSLHIVPTEVEVVGLFEPIDPNADYWSGDASLLQVTQIGTPLRPVGWATAYIAAETYPDLWSSGLPFRYEWHYQVDPQRLDAGQVAQLQDDLRHLDFATGASDLGVAGNVVLRSGLPAVLDAYTPQFARSESMLSIAAIGPFGLAGGVLGMLAILFGTRRRATLALARGRGASGALVLGAQLWEGVILAGAASLLGLLAAVSAIPARASPLSPVWPSPPVRQPSCSCWGRPGRWPGARWACWSATTHRGAGWRLGAW